MPTKKTITKKSNGERSNYELPDGPERYLALDNLPATKPVPKELTEESQRVKIYLPAKVKEAPKLIQSRKIAKVWELELHHGIVPGLPGLNAATP